MITEEEISALWAAHRPRDGGAPICMTDREGYPCTARRLLEELGRYQRAFRMLRGVRAIFENVCESLS